MVSAKCAVSAVSAVSAKCAMSAVSAISTMSTNGSRVITTTKWFGVVMMNAWCCDSGTSVGCVLAVAVVVGCSRCSQAASSSGSGRRNDTNFRIAETLGTAVTLPELNTGTLGIVIPWAWAKTLFLLVLATEANLDNGGEEEEDSA